MSDPNNQEIVIRLPQQLLSEMEGIIKNENVNCNELVHQAMVMYMRERRKRLIRETMQQGYMEMGKINLRMASEAFVAEQEADHTLERLVSGV